MLLRYCVIFEEVTPLRKNFLQEKKILFFLNIQTQMLRNLNYRLYESVFFVSWRENMPSEK